jgi:molybdenum cofactor synthesis domain-containing protein
MTTAGILIIGNEILSAKVQDENAPFLLRALRERGIDVLRVHVIPDVVEEIADEVRSFSRAFDYVLTSGGVGPTHDDVTMEGVALAFARPLVCSSEMEGSLRGALNGQEPNQSQLKMCHVPDGAKLIATKDLWFPVVQVENTYVFPGIPRLLRTKFEAIAHHLVGVPVHLRCVYMSVMESEVAQALYALLDEFPELRLGSYPATERSHDYRTVVTLESRDRTYLARAVDSLLVRIPAGALLRVE